MPWEIRRQFKGELDLLRTALRKQGIPAWRIVLRTVGLLFVGFAQNVPLVRASAQDPATSRRAERTALAGWLLWRFSGPTLFVGYALGIVSLVVIGALSLLACFACIATMVTGARDNYCEREARVLNAVFGGLAAVIALVVFFGVVCGAMVAVGSLVDTAAIGVFSMRALMFVATLSCAAVCLAGWVPREWQPSRLVRND